MSLFCNVSKKCHLTYSSIVKPFSGNVSCFVCDWLLLLMPWRFTIFIFSSSIETILGCYLVLIGVLMSQESRNQQNLWFLTPSFPKRFCWLGSHYAINLCPSWLPPVSAVRMIGVCESFLLLGTCHIFRNLLRGLI